MGDREGGIDSAMNRGEAAQWEKALAEIQSNRPPEAGAKLEAMAAEVQAKKSEENLSPDVETTTSMVPEHVVEQSEHFERAHGGAGALDDGEALRARNEEVAGLRIVAPDPKIKGGTFRLPDIDFYGGPEVPMEELQKRANYHAGLARWLVENVRLKNWKRFLPTRKVGK